MRNNKAEGVGSKSLRARRKVGVKQHLKPSIGSDVIKGTTKPALRRLARKGGVMCISGVVYDDINIHIGTNKEEICRKIVSKGSRKVRREEGSTKKKKMKKNQPKPEERPVWQSNYKVPPPRIYSDQFEKRHRAGDNNELYIFERDGRSFKMKMCDMIPCKDSAFNCVRLTHHQDCVVDGGKRRRWKNQLCHTDTKDGVSRKNVEEVLTCINCREKNWKTRYKGSVGIHFTCFVKWVDQNQNGDFLVDKDGSILTVCGEECYNQLKSEEWVHVRDFLTNTFTSEGGNNNIQGIKSMSREISSVEQVDAKESLRSKKERESEDQNSSLCAFNFNPSTDSSASKQEDIISMSMQNHVQKTNETPSINGAVSDNNCNCLCSKPSSPLVLTDSEDCTPRKIKSHENISSDDLLCALGDTRFSTVYLKAITAMLKKTKFGAVEGFTCKGCIDSKAKAKARVNRRILFIESLAHLKEDFHGVEKHIFKCPHITYEGKQLLNTYRSFHLNQLNSQKVTQDQCLDVIWARLSGPRSDT